MAAAALVDKDVQEGLELIRVLDQRAFPVTGAAWIHFPDEDEWKLIIRTPRAATDLIGALRDVADSMDAVRPGFRRDFDFARIKLVPPSDRVFAALANEVRAEGLNTIRYPGNLINGVPIDGALIYRLAA